MRRWEYEGEFLRGWDFQTVSLPVNLHEPAHPPAYSELRAFAQEDRNLSHGSHGAFRKVLSCGWIVPLISHSHSIHHVYFDVAPSESNSRAPFLVHVLFSVGSHRNAVGHRIQIWTGSWVKGVHWAPGKDSMPWHKGKKSFDSHSVLNWGPL